MFALGADANWAEGHALVAAIEHLASVAGLEMVQLLVEHGADIHCRRLTRYATALHAAATWGRMEIVEFLLAEGVSVIVDDCDWRTPRDRALLMGHSAIAGRLLDLELLERQEGTYLVDSALVESVTQFLDGFQLPDGNESPVRPFLRDLRIRNEAHRLGKLEAWRLRMWYGNARTLVE